MANWNAKESLFIVPICFQHAAQILFWGNWYWIDRIELKKPIKIWAVWWMIFQLYIPTVFSKCLYKVLTLSCRYVTLLRIPLGHFSRIEDIKFWSVIFRISFLLGISTGLVTKIPFRWFLLLTKFLMCPSNCWQKNLHNKPLDFPGSVWLLFFWSYIIFFSLFYLDKTIFIEMNIII